MMEQFRAIELALDNAYGLDDPVGSDDATIAVLFDRWQEGSDLTYPFDVAEVFEPVARRIEQLLVIDNTNDRETLLAMAQEGQRFSDPAVAVAAWRKLGEMTDPAWPATVTQLEQNLALNLWLNAVVIQDAQQKQKLTDELEEQKYRRWSRCFAGLMIKLSSLLLPRSLFSQVWSRHTTLLSRGLNITSS